MHVYSIQREMLFLSKRNSSTSRSETKEWKKRYTCLHIIYDLVLHVHFNSKRSGFPFKEKWFFFQGEMFQQAEVEQKNEKKRYT